MFYFHLIILSLVQGITEFLPISSSAHLILLPRLAGWQDQGLIYDMAAHLGSLVAIVYYFRSDLRHMLRDWFVSLTGGNTTENARLAWYVIYATIPVMVAGFFLFDMVATLLRDPVIIAATTIGFGLLLWWADVSGRKEKPLGNLTLQNAIWIGLAQVAALVPGTSRSGITMTAGLMLGLGRRAAARFSFYLSIPTIFLATVHTLYRYSADAVGFSPAGFGVVTVVSAISAGITIHLFLQFIEKIGMLPFVIYRLLLGTILLLLFFP